ncbi:MAG: hypothetical protein COW19_06410 [Zetaproteobacteria bacterium CG12_big_fil_rev_8_21_14_0_65_55_1124]|nr:MAG: hypothetical protein AUJ58_01575 [Zetaproteobacteria bacterium CG1_02_55_237]PIS18832.1 MAG: hypothetical protein COT53_08705 [Zetaproteobacteria bacterium CG08_land_8_20_14_0_20_55_17]PIW42751.1 MAG: hypothetical protein COW19_06410 [Zetaproteobacteria bacterium CG12_big_fil_rev_8_21_14_0_65_55_1124]PIY51777.1 MAG: hypothetical protein COZ01_09965 [Zetaproteobacteria bacterium CG_4_10_14_0_8_um_filter_55_43]PIZ40029.1 MAG: hypothetical protein COY36_00865 [Zetaproteobacteria bacterium 
MQSLDIAITALFAVGLLQAGWLSLVAARRGVPSSLLIRGVWSLSSIWVLLWPVYTSVTPLFVAIAMFALTVSVPVWLKPAACRQLVVAWSDGGSLPWPMWMFVLALTGAAIQFSFYPEFGFGTALSLCLGLPLAHWWDRAGRLCLRFPANPGQTLPGHISLMITVVICCGWSLHVYQQIGWFESMTATLLAGCAASAARGLIAHPFNVPVIALTIGGVLWLL